jgi:hypothetical protein
MTALRRRMTEELQVRGYADRTIGRAVMCAVVRMGR